MIATPCILNLMAAKFCWGGSCTATPNLRVPRLPRPTGPRSRYQRFYHSTAAFASAKVYPGLSGLAVVAEQIGDHVRVLKESPTLPHCGQ